MNIRDIREYIEAHYDEYPNFDGRTAEEVLKELPDQDPRYDNEAGLSDMLLEINYHGEEESEDDHDNA